MADQLLKCGTSIGANVSEAGGGTNQKRFYSKDVHSLQRSQRNEILVAANK
ncbi:hypothetical protein [Aureitalea sp. L0-47]|uniref:hypothetical protein n=1 Tax=Aureitalea sp. L0-47 TaxID=2816962 RepID=UPI002AA2A73B|nr:hypothetical protein [Aureitalea sp. L0-47]